MKIGVVGPTRIKEFCIAIGREEYDYNNFLEEIGRMLAKTDHEIVILPASQTAQGRIASFYKDLGGKKVIGVVPEDDTEFGLNDLDPDFSDENINCGTWRNQPEKMCEISDILLIVGMAPGAMIEICYAKWFKVKKLYIMTDFLSQKLHPEIEKDIPFQYITIQDLEEKLR